MKTPDTVAGRLIWLLVPFLALALAVPVVAQEEDEQDEPEDDTTFEETIVVVGTRTEGRTVTESPVAVDVISSVELMSSGDNDLIVTTKATTSVGETVVLTGNIVLDKDFGAGYSYPVLLEDASITTE